MITDKSPSSITVTLILSTATREDSGLYQCQPGGETDLETANITVLVLQQTDYTAMLSETTGQISLVSNSGVISARQVQEVSSLYCCSSLLSSSRPHTSCCSSNNRVV